MNLFKRIFGIENEYRRSERFISALALFITFVRGISCLSLIIYIWIQFFIKN